MTAVTVGSRVGTNDRPPGMSPFNTFFDSPAKRPYEEPRAQLDAPARPRDGRRAAHDGHPRSPRGRVVRRFAPAHGLRRGAAGPRRGRDEHRRARSRLPLRRRPRRRAAELEGDGLDRHRGERPPPGPARPRGGECHPPVRGPPPGHRRRGRRRRGRVLPPAAPVLHPARLHRQPPDGLVGGVAPRGRVPSRVRHPPVPDGRRQLRPLVQRPARDRAADGRLLPPLPRQGRGRPPRDAPLHPRRPVPRAAGVQDLHQPLAHGDHHRRHEGDRGG